MAKATFGAGCFWHVESAFQGKKGVIKTTVGYSGGTVVNPTYKQVCRGDTGHAEVVEVEYDPALISYELLLDFFWSIHDPTSLNQQGPDVGEQYRSVIFFHDDAQEAKAKIAMKNQATLHSRPIVTQLRPAEPFYRAEEYHQCYFKKQSGQ
jgi:peptide-methionine (S)-S-oxide reductase